MNKKTTWILVVCLALFACLVAQVLIRKEVAINFEVLADPDFLLTVEPQHAGATPECHRGEDFNFVITASAVSGFVGDIALSAENLPTGVAVTFGDPMLNPAGIMQTLMTVVIAVDAPIGPISFLIVGTEVNE